MRADSLALRLLKTAVVAVLAALSMGDGCGYTPVPPRVIAPTAHTWVGVRTGVLVLAADTSYACEYVVDWGDFTMDTTLSVYRGGETAYVEHSWTASGAMAVKARALRESRAPRASDWSMPETVTVSSNGVPVIDAVRPDEGIVRVKGAADLFTVKAHDPDGDSIRAVFDWGDGRDTTTSFLSSPCSVDVSHVFGQADTFNVVVSVQDTKGALSVPRTISVRVGTAGGVKWYWQSYGGGGLSTSPVVISDGQQELLYAGCSEDFKFYAMGVSGSKVKASATTRWPGYIFRGNPAYCEATQHIIVSSDEGELYALTLSLSRAWQWPNKFPRESLTGIPWGAPAIRDNRLYVPREDESLYYFIDSVDHGVRVATYAANAGIVDAPVIDAQGNVYFGTDSGYLYKVGPELDTMLWRTRLIANGEIHGLVVGRDGAIYCGSESSRVYAVDPVTGDLRWTVKTDGLPLRPAIGQSAIFVGTDRGAVYSLDPNTGSMLWQKTSGQGVAFNSAPIVAANGYVYLQSDTDVLYAIGQADGTQIWACDCNYYLPGGGRGNSPRQMRPGLTDYDPNPTIMSNGDILVVGGQALFCVVGYPEGPLDPLAPWPKWQHDLYNTGYVAGGR
jgi:outer membrane protein assembly factor BamB